VLLDQEIQSFDIDTFAKVGSAPMSMTNVYRPLFTRWGRYGFAITRAPDHFGVATVFVGRSTLVP
jgi:hypothetical protein